MKIGLWIDKKGIIREWQRNDIDKLKEKVNVNTKASHRQENVTAKYLLVKTVSHF